MAVQILYGPLRALLDGRDPNVVVRDTAQGSEQADRQNGFLGIDRTSNSLSFSSQPVVPLKGPIQLSARRSRLASKN